MPSFPYTIRVDNDEPFGSVVTMDRVEAETPFEAANVLHRLGKLPADGPIFYVCVVTQVHDNGVPYKVISVPMEPGDRVTERKRGGGTERRGKEMAKLESRIRIGGLIVAFAAFFVSLGCNTLLYAEDSGFTVGLGCLLFGIGYPAWYANLFLFLAGVSLKQKQPLGAAGFASVATALSLTALWIREVPQNEAGMLAPVIGYGAGYFLWVGCGLVLLGAGIACAAVGGKSREPSLGELAHA